MLLLFQQEGKQERLFVKAYLMKKEGVAYGFRNDNFIILNHLWVNDRIMHMEREP